MPACATSVLVPQASLADAASYWDRVIGGAEVIRKQTVAPQPEAAKPPEPRQAVFLLANSKWPEGGRIITAGKHRTESLPVDVAKVALEHGHALQPDHEPVRHSPGI